MKIVLASSNPGKLAEMRALLAHRDYQILNQSELGVVDAIEDGDSFQANALIKARNASKHTGLAAIADDSGLEVDYLDGRPGIRSARYAGENASDQDNVDKLLHELAGVPDSDRSARFHCVIVMVQNEKDQNPLICKGTWEGSIATKPSGDYGFGYDPVFYVAQFNCTSAELSPSIKNKHSHRGSALKTLKKELL